MIDQKKKEAALTKAEQWLENPEDIVLQFKHLINLEGVFKERTQILKKELTKLVLGYGWTMHDVIHFENDAAMHSNFNSDTYINTTMAYNGCVGERVGLLY